MTFSSANNFIRSIPNDKWQIDKNSDGVSVTWLPVLTLIFDFAPKRIFGLSDKGFWTERGNKGDIEIINSRDSCFHIIICLEKDRVEFQKTLKLGLQQQNLSIDIAETFPTAELLKMALQTDTHWAEKAAFWLQETDMDKELEIILTVFIDKKSVSQSARHRVFKILKRWQRNN